MVERLLSVWARAALCIDCKMREYDRIIRFVNPPVDGLCSPVTAAVLCSRRIHRFKLNTWWRGLLLALVTISTFNFYYCFILFIPDVHSSFCGLYHVWTKAAFLLHIDPLTGIDVCMYEFSHYKLGTLHTGLVLVLRVAQYSGADKYLARSGRKQATATEDFEFYISHI
jgi:hypothetical protein